MTADNSRAFLVSTLLHGAVLAVALYASYAVATKPKDRPPLILELVAGEGTNFRATAAPALGSPDSIKLALPKTTPSTLPIVTEPPRPEPPKPVTPKAETPLVPPTPKAPPPTTKATVTPKAETTPNFAKQIQRRLIVAESRAKKQVAKEREAEAKRSKEEADRAKKLAAAKGGTQKIERIDAKGIAKGVVGGSTSNMEGGAGGTALTVAERSEADSYAAYLNKMLTEELDQVTGLQEGLKAEAEFEVQMSGRLARGRIVRSSRNERFDQAVLRAIAVIRMPEGPPKGFERMQTVTFNSNAKN